MLLHPVMLNTNPVPLPMGTFMPYKNIEGAVFLLYFFFFFNPCRWFAADGNHQACGCCDSTCGSDGGIAASPFGGK